MEDCQVLTKVTFSLHQKKLKDNLPTTFDTVPWIIHHIFEQVGNNNKTNSAGAF